MLIQDEVEAIEFRLNLGELLEDKPEWYQRVWVEAICWLLAYLAGKSEVTVKKLEAE